MVSKLCMALVSELGVSPYEVIIVRCMDFLVPVSLTNVSTLCCISKGKIVKSS